MNFIEELKWRNMLHDSTPGIEEALANNNVRGYIGFDPTAPSLTIGNYVQVMLLSFFQKSGHSPIVLMGGATGRIGDPSGKDKERDLKSYEELDANLEAQVNQIKHFLNFDEGPNKAIIVNNLDFYRNMNALEFLRDVGKTITISYMLSKESVKKRLDSGMSFTEFSYQLLQGYDFQCLYQKHGCSIQMGGSDQWGNITAGTEFIRRNLNKKAYAVTTPLLTKSDGSKFGKSEGGNIWIDGKLTSPYKFYQFWLNATDDDIPKYFRYFSFKSKEEVEALEQTFSDDPRKMKQIIAEELTCRVHGADAHQNAQQVSQLIFNPKASSDMLNSLDQASLQMVYEELPSFQIEKSLIQSGLNVLDLITEHTTIVSSKSEARRAIKGNALSINKVKVTSDDLLVNHESLLHGSYLMLENGKKNKFMLKIV